MSASNSLAKKRRAPPLTPEPQSARLGGAASQYSQQQYQSGIPTPTSSETPTSGFTLQQVIAVIDKRLLILEKTTAELKTAAGSAPPTPVQPQQQKQTLQQQPAVPPPPKVEVIQAPDFSDMFREYDDRFEMLATEISNLKDMLLNLQSYTMDVNKMLLEERANPPISEGADAKYTLANGDAALEPTADEFAEEEVSGDLTDASPVRFYICKNRYKNIKNIFIQYIGFCYPIFNVRKTKRYYTTG
jgi:hypothetical protein